MQEKNNITVAVSGGFDPLHAGHIQLFAEARELGNHLVVILNSDKFLMEKKGYVFMPFEERKKIIEAIKYVGEVFDCIDEDQTVCNSLRILQPDIFANGGDRDGTNLPSDEIKLCMDLGIRLIYGLAKGYEHIHSSGVIEKFCDDGIFGLMQKEMDAERDREWEGEGPPCQAP